MESPTPGDLARALVDLAEWSQAFSAEQSGDGLSERLREHLGGEITGLPVVSRGLEGYQRANFQMATDAYLDMPERGAQLIVSEQRGAHGLSERFDALHGRVVQGGGQRAGAAAAGERDACEQGKCGAA